MADKKVWTVEAQAEWLKTQQDFMRISLADARKAFTEKWNPKKVAGINFKEKAYCQALGLEAPEKASKGSKAVGGSSDPWKAVLATLKLLGDQLEAAQGQSGLSGASASELLKAYQARILADAQKAVQTTES